MARGAESRFDPRGPTASGPEEAGAREGEFQGGEAHTSRYSGPVKARSANTRRPTQHCLVTRKFRDQDEMEQFHREGFRPDSGTLAYPGRRAEMAWARAGSRNGWSP